MDCLEVWFGHRNELADPNWAIPEKNPNRVRGGGRGGGLRIYLFENTPGIFYFFTLPLEIPDKIKLNSWIFHKIVLKLLEIPRPVIGKIGVFRRKNRRFFLDGQG